MEFCQDAQFKLEAIPSSTVEYVESLTFLDTIQEKVSLLRTYNVKGLGILFPCIRGLSVALVTVCITSNSFTPAQN